VKDEANPFEIVRIVRSFDPCLACSIHLLRGKKAVELLDRLAEAVGRRIKASSFDEFGNFAFGIKEHIDIPGVKYRADIGIFGMDVMVSVGRPGYRIARRRVERRRIPLRQRVSRLESIVFAEKYLNLKVVEAGE
ncbi:MAG: nickel-dependent hydrogenase large subunit, partial [Candidatus Korarchaeum sp.]